MQIWKSTDIFVFTLKQHAEGFALYSLFELWAPKIYETFDYKHTETIQYVKK